MTEYLLSSNTLVTISKEYDAAGWLVARKSAGEGRAESDKLGA